MTQKNFITDTYKTLWILNVPEDQRAALEDFFTDVQCIFPSIMSDPGNLQSRISASEAPAVLILDPMKISSVLANTVIGVFPAFEIKKSLFSLREQKAWSSLGFCLKPMDSDWRRMTSVLFSDRHIAEISSDEAAMERGRALLERYRSLPIAVRNIGCKDLPEISLFTDAVRPDRHCVLLVGMTNSHSVQANLASLVQSAQDIRKRHKNSYISVVSNCFITIGAISKVHSELRQICDEVHYTPWHSRMGETADVIYSSDPTVCLDGYLHGKNMRRLGKMFDDFDLEVEDKQAAIMALLDRYTLWHPASTSTEDAFDTLAETVMRTPVPDEFCLDEVSLNLHLIMNATNGMDYALAVELLEASLVIAPDNCALWIRLGDVCIETEDFERAIDCFTKAIELCPNVPAYYAKRSRCRTKMGQIDIPARDDLLKAISLSGGSDYSLWSRYFNLEWERAPLTDALLSQYSAVCTRYLKTPKRQKGMDLLMRYAAMLVEAGMTKRAFEMYNAGLANGEVAAQFLGLQYAMDAEAQKRKTAKPVPLRLIHKAAYEHVLANRTRFTEMVDEADGDVIIVGNGPQELETNNGAEIDSRKMVIRFNTFPTHHPHIQDYGSKVDLWVRMQTGAYVKVEDRFAPNDIMLTGCNRLNRTITDWSWVHEKVEAGFNMSVMPKEAFYHVSQQVKRVPTAGIVLAYMLYREMGPLKEEQIFGCSFAKSAATDAYHYGDNQAFLSNRHELDLEAAFFKTLTDEREVTYYTPYYLRNAKKNPAASNKSTNWNLQQFEGQFDRVFGFSPGVEGYKVFGTEVEVLPLKTAIAAANKSHKDLRANPKAYGALSTIDDPNRCLFLGFGQKESGKKAREIAKSLGAHAMGVEYGLISSSHLPSQTKSAFSLMLDDVGVFYDTVNSSRLEMLLDEGFGTQTLELTARARAFMDTVLAHDITKYNNAPAMVLPPRKKAHRILVIDQTSGDLSIEYGQCGTHSFQDMLEHAMAREDAEVFFKPHPETLAGAKGANFDISALRQRDGLTVLEESCNIMSLMSQIDEVYVMVSGVGFEALMAGKTVRCFGVPFYAARGLTIDMAEPVRPRRPLSIEELVAGVFLQSHQFYDPDTKAPVSPETCLERLVPKLPRDVGLVHDGSDAFTVDLTDPVEASAFAALRAGNEPIDLQVAARYVAPGDTVADVSGGTGLMARGLADLGAFRVHAITESAATLKTLKKIDDGVVAPLRKLRNPPRVTEEDKPEKPEDRSDRLDGLLAGEPVSFLRLASGIRTIDILETGTAIFENSPPKVVICWLSPRILPRACAFLKPWYGAPVVVQPDADGKIQEEPSDPPKGEDANDNYQLYVFRLPTQQAPEGATD